MPASIDPRQRILDAIFGRPHDGIPIWLINPMEWRAIDHLAGVPEGSYRNDPIPTYRRMLLNAGSSMVDQWIPLNPLSMGSHGYEDDRPRNATTGAEEIIVDEMPMREPEDVVAHLERVVIPRLEQARDEFDGEAAAKAFVDRERETQELLGDALVKVPYGCLDFPKFRYAAYGYSLYFMAFVLYPEVMERVFRLEGDLAARRNAAIAGAIVDAELPPLVRLDFDMADSRGTLVRVEQLDELWFPHFNRAIQPALDAGIKLIWHCDGNLMAMVPRLLEAGLHGFQGFQYEDGMDYEKICRMTTREGEPLIIIAGVSVTTTLPHGTPRQVREELDWLVAHGPRERLFLGASSSIAPGVPLENLGALVEGFHHYRAGGR